MRLPLIALALVSSAVPARADVDYFNLPSGNITCYVGIEADSVDISCTIFERTPTLPRPASCSGGWGHTVSMFGTGRVTIECDDPRLSYTRPAAPPAQVLDYGRRMELRGISCGSSKQGLECRNADGHGFLLSRGKQRVF
ncbi:hypothetical protein PVT71_19460 [Salipiger sp. H15]|uniref:Cyanovirin-N domain-containing protein n=1 Tax=Alloyangia sp. H15 TaxID=3029062 RepID=A0AAU8AKK9_9RHOB